MHKPLHARHYRIAVVLVCLLVASAALYSGHLHRQRPWLRIPRLRGYYNGIKTIVLERPGTRKDHGFEAPWPGLTDWTPTPRPYDVYSSLENVQPCYLDAQQRVPAPKIYAYDGLPYEMPEPSLGSYELLGLQDNVCFDRFGRYGPYGLGYGVDQGGIGLGNDTENADSDDVWSETGKIDYSGVDWAGAQGRCHSANEHRFRKANDTRDAPGLLSRTAIVIRCYEGYKWTPMAILNFRAMVTELALKSGGEYDVHLLMQVREIKYAQWTDESTRKQYLARHVPAEFQGLVTLWSESDMKIAYPGDFGRPYENPSRKEMHGVFRSPHLALQVFAKAHPEYCHFWNWEMDVRVIGNFYELLDRIGAWAGQRRRHMLWELNARYFVAGFYKTWANFSDSVRENDFWMQRPAFGPVQAPWRAPLTFEKGGKSILPDDCFQHPNTCGEGEPADLITLSPIFDPKNSGWWFRQDVTGYCNDLSEDLPRRASIVTVARLSRRLLLAMDEEVYHHRHNMFAEMFPSTVSLHHGFKAVYAPHPVYIDRAWDDAAEVDRHFNSGERHSVSGKDGPFSPTREKVNKITSWYFSSKFTSELWLRWLGYAAESGWGGINEEAGKHSTGRMCLRSMLLHPVKHEHPSERR